MTVAVTGSQQAGSRKKVSNRTLVGTGCAVALALAFFVSPLASSSPDGLEKVAAEHEIDAGVTGHAAANSPLADYSTSGVGNERLSTGIAGVLGTVLTLGIGYGVFALVRRTKPRDDDRKHAASAA